MQTTTDFTMESTIVGLDEIVTAMNTTTVPTSGTEQHSLNHNI